MHDVWLLSLPTCENKCPSPSLSFLLTCVWNFTRSRHASLWLISVRSCVLCFYLYISFMLYRVTCLYDWLWLVVSLKKITLYCCNGHGDLHDLLLIWHLLFFISENLSHNGMSWVTMKKDASIEQTSACLSVVWTKKPDPRSLLMRCQETLYDI